MDMTCDVVMDLIALYKDGCASEQTRRAIRMHLHDCPSCRRAYAAFEKSELISCENASFEPVENVKVNYQWLAQKLRKQRMLSNVFFAAAITVSVALGAIAAAKLLPPSEN